MTNQKINDKKIIEQHHERIVALLKAGVFDLNEGKAEINCHSGKIQSVVIHTRTYKRAVGSDIIPT